MKKNIQANNKKIRVVVFGIFDGVHEGHRSLFAQAREFGEELVVIVGRDEICRKLKNKTPKFSEEERRSRVEQEPLVSKAILGDKEPSSYEIVEEFKPDVACFGYDQEKLEEDFKNWLQKTGKQIEVHRLFPFEPETYHSSLL